MYILSTVYVKNEAHTLLFLIFEKKKELIILLVLIKEEQTNLK